MKVAWHQWPQRVLIGAVEIYRLMVSPWIGGQCRYFPTCSAYALEALRVHGALRGTLLSVWRVLRCGPWCEGGHDPVPSLNDATKLPRAASCTSAPQAATHSTPPLAAP